MDRTTQEVQIQITFGHRGKSKTFSLPFNFSGLDSSSKVFFKAKFRDKTSFTNYKSEEMMMAYHSHLMRILDLIVFRGNNTNFSDQTDTEVTETVYLSDGSTVLLSNNMFTGPYRRIKTTSDAIPYSQKLLLENLIFDFGDMARITPSGVANCAHKIDNGFCLFCETGFVRSDDFTRCESCETDYFFDNNLQKCLPIPSYSINLQTGKVEPIYTEFTKHDIVDFGYEMDIETDVFSYLPFGNASSTIEPINDQNMLDLFGSSIYFIDVQLEFSFSDISKINNPFAFLNLATSTNKHIWGQYFFDKVKFDSSKGSVTKSISFVIDYDVADTYKNVNFLINLRADASIILEESSGNSHIQIYMFTKAEYLNHLRKSLKYPDGFIQSVSFPLNTQGSDTVYLSQSLHQYEALDLSFFTQVPGYYLEHESEFVYLRKFSANCESCSSFRKCTECIDGYFLRHRACFECDASCSLCETYETACTSTSTPSPGPSPSPGTGSGPIPPGKTTSTLHLH